MLFVSTFEKLWMLHKHIFQIHAQIFSRCLISFLVLFKNCHERMAFIIVEIFIFIFIFFLRIIYKKEGLVILEWLIRNYMHCIHVFGIRSTVSG